MKRTRTMLGGALAALVLPLAALTATPANADDGDQTEPALNWSNYEKVTLSKDVGEPIDMAILPDKRILHTTRNGEIRLTDPAAGTTTTVNTIPVYSYSEDGLQTIALDPDFENNQWVYVYYSPKTMDPPYVQETPPGAAPNSLPAGQDESYWHQWKGYNQLSRFKWTGNSLDLSTEQVIIKVEVNRGQCCHVAGDIDFDAEGNLYLSTGDNTPAGTPGANGYAPNNDAPGMNPGLDARRGPGNSNDLRGKILRIKVQEDGSYTIPEGNLFPPGTPKTRPEIFVMGVRNPFRMEVDEVTGVLAWGDYGPDAGNPHPERGPMGYVEWNIIPLSKPVNAGWPYCTGHNFNYNNWDFENARPREWFDCDNGPINDSRWNTGLEQLPPAMPSTVYYGDRPGDQPEEWRGLVDFEPQGGQGPMGGPVYHFDPNNPSPTKFPPYWDKKHFFGEFSQDFLAAFTVAGPEGPVTKIEHFLPNAELTKMGMPITDNPMDMEFGPDGSLYVLEYGDGFFRANPDAGLYRIDYKGPITTTPLTVTATSRCVGTSAYVAVTAVNDGDVPADITLTTPYGAKTVTGVAPGKQAYQSFNARAGQIDAGTVTVTGTSTIDGKQVTTTYQAAYNAISCG